MKYGKSIIGTLLLAAALAACLGTLTLPRYSAVTVRVEAGRTARLLAEPLTLAKQIERGASRLFSVQEAGAYIPSIITDVRLTVTASDMATLTRTEHAAGLDSVTISIDVPIGPARNFLVTGLTASGAAVYSGQQIVDLAGAPVDIPITMTSGTVSVPQLVSTVPPDSAVGVVYMPFISATFTEDLDPRTVTAATFTVRQTLAGAVVPGTVVASGTTATFTPAGPLLPDTDYTVAISTGVRSAYGIPLTQSVVWLFTTLPPVPVITAMSPADGATGVALNAVVTAAFSVAMDPATINGSTFTLNNGATGTVSYNAAGRTATFVTTGLSPSTGYTATITTGAVSARGVALAADHVWSFATGTTTDTTPPAFAGIESGQVISQTSVRLFWQPATDDMTPQAGIVYLVSQSTTSGVFTLPPAYVTVPAATFFDVTGLTPGLTYYFKVNARDAAGNADGNSKQWWSTPSGRFVDAVSGSDSTGDGSETNPFRTITRALLTIAPTNTVSLGVYAKAGTYNAAVGETFPVQLTPFTTLFCQGPGNSTVIDATGSGKDALYGNAGAAVDGCAVVAESGTTGIDDSIGGAEGTPGLPARITVSNTLITGPALNAVTLSAASSIATTTISGAGVRGVYIRAGRPSVDLTGISGKQTGIEVAADTDPSIDNNVIENNGVGIIVTAAGGRPSVRNNVISNNTTGIKVSAGAPLIHKNEVKTNLIAGNDVGIEIEGGMPTVSFNTVTNNNRGIVVVNGTPAVRSNSIYCNAVFDLQVLANVPVDARKNAWDHEPPAVSLSPCILGTDVCYSHMTGVPDVSTWTAPPAGACP